MPDFTALDALNIEATPTTQRVPNIKPSTYNSILAVDPSIANTGWVFIQEGYIDHSGNLKPPKMATGAEDVLRRGEVLLDEFLKLLRKYAPTYVVHELPPVTGANRLMHVESSYVASMALRAACDVQGVWVKGIQAQKAKKRVTGVSRGWSKADIREAVMALDPTLKHLKPRNEAIYDAIAVGWTASEMEDGWWHGK